MLPIPSAIPLLTFPAPKYSALQCCSSSSAEHSTSTTRIFSGTFVSFAPPCDHTSCGTCNRRVMYPPVLDVIVCRRRDIMWYGFRCASEGATGGRGESGAAGIFV